MMMMITVLMKSGSTAVGGLHVHRSAPSSRRFPSIIGRIGHQIKNTDTRRTSSSLERTIAAAAEEELELGRHKKAVAKIYDEGSDFWERTFGEHIHVGYYDKEEDAATVSMYSAQTRLIEEALLFASVPGGSSSRKPEHIIDVGCGIGGSTRYLAKKYGARCHGITLSPVQVQRAQALTAQQGLEDRVSFQVADAMNQPFPDGKFDLLLSVESADYMPDKRKFMSELARVGAPGGTVIILTLCWKDPSSEEIKMMNKIRDAFHIQPCSRAHYLNLLQSFSFQDIKVANWTPFITPSFPLFVRSALTWRGISLLLTSGWKTVKQALASPSLLEAIQRGLIQYEIICAKIPQ